MQRLITIFVTTVVATIVHLSYAIDALFIDRFRTGNLAINAAMMVTAVLQVEEVQHLHANGFPLLGRTLGHGLKRRVISRESFAAAPIRANQIEVRPVARAAQVGGVAPVIAPVQRHPTGIRPSHSAPPRLRAEPGSWPSADVRETSGPTPDPLSSSRQDCRGRADTFQTLPNKSLWRPLQPMLSPFSFMRCS